MSMHNRAALPVMDSLISRGTRPRGMQTCNAAVLICILIMALTGAVRPAAAQCVTLDPPCTNEPPAISISPGDGQTYTSASLDVTVTWSDDGSLNFGTRSVQLNGTTVSLGFTQHSGGSGVSSGTVQLAPGPNTIRAYICDTMSSCDVLYSSYTYNAPPPPQQHAPPHLDLSSHHPGVSVPSPFDGQAGYATPAYVSMDQPRSVGLVYSSSRAKPTGFIQFDAIDNSTQPVSRIGVKIKDASGAFVTLLNGSTEMSYNGTHGRNRVAAQWDVSHLTTGAYKYTIVARTYFTDGASAESTDTTRVLVVNEAQSPFGAGWSMPGLQWAKDQTDGVVVTDGDGRAVFFRAYGTSIFISPDGEFSTLSRVSSTLRRTYPDGSLAVFNASTGLLSYVQDRFGNQTTYGYSSGRVSTITDPAGKQFTFSYNGSGKLTTMTDAVSRATSVTIDGSGDLTQIVAPGSTTAFAGSYDSNHRLRTRTDMRGKTAGYAYDFAGRVAADTLPSVQLYTLGSTRPVISYKAWESAVLVSTCTCNRPHIDPDTLRATVTDPVGNPTRIAYDRYYGPTEVNAPLSHTTTIDRNPDGLPTRIVEPSGATRSYSWDSDGNIKTVQQPETGQTITFTYHSTWKTDPIKVAVGSSETNYTYGTSGELKSARVNQDSTRYEYDTVFRLKKITDPQNHITNYTYQTTGFRNTATVSETSSAGTTRTTTFGYDSYGRTSGITTPVGTTSYLYDVLDRVTRVTDATSQATDYEYDGPYVETVTDAASKVFRFNHNDAGWVVSEVDPNSRYTYYWYDAGGNLRTVENREGQPITMVPDALGRVISRTADSATTTYAYDNPAGRWIAASNSQSTDTIFHDDRGRVAREVTVFGTQKYEVVSEYLGEGPRKTVQVLGPSWSRTVTYGYSNALQLMSISQMVGGSNLTTLIGYNSDGLPSAINYPTSPSRQQLLTYTASHRPGSNGWTGSLPALGVIYGFDSMERLTSRTNAALDSARILTYNARGELTRAKDSEYAEEWVCPTLEPMDCYWDEQTTVVSDVPYSYDAVGNRTGTGVSLQSTSNRYQTFGGYTFEYDLDGNTTRKYKSGFDQYFSWNSLGQLTSVTTNGVSVTYGYNGFGERVYRVSGSDVRRYVYDGANIVLEINSTGTKLREYTHFPGVDQPHSMFDGSGAVYYYATDYPGQVAGLFNASGTVVNRYRYSAWGTPETTSEAISNSLRFMSREIDSQTGMYYVRNRWYDAAVARFLSEDPIGLDGGINVYSYAGNSPTNVRDPYGLCPGCSIWLLTALRPPTLDPLEVNARIGGGWPFSTPRNQGANGNPSGRGTGVASTADRPPGNGGANQEAVEQIQACAATLPALGLSIGGDVLFFSGASIAVTGAIAVWAGRAGLAAVRSGAVRTGRGALARSSRVGIAGGWSMVGAGSAEATAGLTDGAVLTAVSNDPWWTAFPLTGSAYAMDKFARTCFRAAVGG